jgi:hypothetical protein
MQNSLFLILFTFLISSCLSYYNETMALEFWYVSGTAYCTVDSIEQQNCGPFCKWLSNEGIVFDSVSLDDSVPGGLLYLTYRDDFNKFFILGFRGTASTSQLINEATGSGPVEYKLHELDVKNPQVFGYVYRMYVEHIRENITGLLSQAYELYPNYTFIFTGHSLGGALTTHAALDMILSGVIPKEQAVVYNFGSPRVGNYDFAQAVVDNIPNIYRLQHYKDIVPHLPPCVAVDPGHCLKSLTEIDKVRYADVWPAWHIWTNIFYDNVNSTSYVICDGGEDPECGDKYQVEECSTAYHGDYLNVQIVCKYSNNTFSSQT